MKKVINEMLLELRDSYEVGREFVSTPEFLVWVNAYMAVKMSRVFSQNMPRKVFKKVFKYAEENGVNLEYFSDYAETGSDEVHSWSVSPKNAPSSDERSKYVDLLFDFLTPSELLE